MMFFKNDWYKQFIRRSLGLVFSIPIFLILLIILPDSAKITDADFTTLFIVCVGVELFFLSLVFALFQAIPHLELSQDTLHTIHPISKKKIKTLAYTSIQLAEIQKIGINYQLIITTLDHQRVMINGFKESTLQQILQAIAPYVVQTRSQPIQIDLPLQGDIGKRVLYVIGFGVFLIGFSFYISHLQHAWHSSSEQMFLWLLLSIPLAIAIAYLWIVGEKKDTPWIAASVSGVVLGAGFNLVFLESHRLWNEQHTTIAYYAFKLDKKEPHRQKWMPVDGNRLVFHDGYVWVHDVWKKGFNPKLEQGQTYTVAVQQSHLNDIAFPTSAFHQAKLPPSQTQ